MSPICVKSMGFKIRHIKTSWGEEMPVLLVDGMPSYDVCVYIVSERRSSGNAANTLLKDLSCIALLYQWARSRGIDLDERFSQYEWLTLYEIDDLCDFLHYDRRDLENVQPKIVSFSGTAIEKIRMQPEQRSRQVQFEFVAVRIAAVRDYLQWKALDRISKLNISDNRRPTLFALKDQMVKSFDARKPKKRGKSSVGLPEGLSKEDQKILLQVIHPDDLRNPWKSRSVRDRNYLLILLLLRLGLRRGEVLGLKIGDIDFRENTILIRRRADDPDDPRRRQPNAKTRDRRLRLEPEMMTLIHYFISQQRSKVSGAKTSPFLFLTAKSGRHLGKPLSLDAFGKIFLDIRSKIPELPRDLTAHILRHTSNDLFSEIMDSQNVSVAQEEMIRNEFYGWAVGSKTAANYTRRHIRLKAEKASLDLQKKLEDPSV